MTLDIEIHALNDSHNPFFNSKAAQGPPIGPSYSNKQRLSQGQQRRGRAVIRKSNFWYQKIGIKVLFGVPYASIHTYMDDASMPSLTISLWWTYRPLSGVLPQPHRITPKLQQYDHDIIYKPGPQMIFSDVLLLLNPKPILKFKLDRAIHLWSSLQKRLGHYKNTPPQGNPLTTPTGDTRWLASPCSNSAIIPTNDNSGHTGTCCHGEHTRNEWRAELHTRDTLAGNTKKDIYAGHQGITKCHLRATCSLLWPGINNDVEKTVRECWHCQWHQLAQGRKTWCSAIFRWDHDTHWPSASSNVKIPDISSSLCTVLIFYAC